MYWNKKRSLDIARGTISTSEVMAGYRGMCTSRRDDVEMLQCRGSFGGSQRKTAMEGKDYRI